MTWVIETWMGRRVFPDETFDSFQEARDRISEYANAEAGDEDDYNGICEDLYAEEREDA